MDEQLIETLDTDQQRALENVRKAAARIWARPLHRYFTNHTLEHSQRIIALLDGLAAGMMQTDKRLTPTEVFVLLAATYLHDIGMQNEKFASGDLVEIREHHQQTAEMIYAVFEAPAEAFPTPLARDPAIVEAVALVARGHRRVNLDADDYDSFVHGGETLRLRLLAALLRFGDELDIDHRVYGDPSVLAERDCAIALEWIEHTQRITTAHTTHTLFLGIGGESRVGHDAAATARFHQTHQRPPTIEESIEYLYGEPVSPADFLIMSSKMGGSGALPALICDGDTQVYYLPTPSIVA